MSRTLRTAVMAFAITSNAALAQDAVWVQLEARPSADAAIERARAYDRETDNVAGFRLDGRWSAVVLGPFPDQRRASAALDGAWRAGLAPADAFLTDGARFERRIYPDGPDGAPTVDSGTDAIDTATAAAPDETLAEARRSERALTADARRNLQIALRWAGVYDAGIDGAFGPGTRAAMEAWQVAQGAAPTGVLTTGQRAALRAAYDAVLEDLDLRLVRDEAAGVEVRLPSGVVAFTDHRPPFARYGPTGDIPRAQVLLISQAGDRTTLGGLYEIIQTLAVVPAEGARSRGADGFTITGTDETHETFVTATLSDGRIKGFALIWPAGDTSRFVRIRDEMQASFAAIGGVLDPARTDPAEDQAIDLVSGLQVRQPRAAHAGFYVDAAGSVLTALASLQGCDDITLDGDVPATLDAGDPGLGLAILTPLDPLAPPITATFQTRVPRLSSEVAVAGYPYGGVLPAPTLTFGALADIRGLEGEETLNRLTVATRPGDAGGPVYDAGGAVLGVLLPRAADADRILPPDVGLAVDAESSLAFLAAHGIDAETTAVLTPISAEARTRRAAEGTVLVRCW